MKGRVASARGNSSLRCPQARRVAWFGLLSYTCPLWLFRKAGNCQDNNFLPRTIPRNAVQPHALGLLFPTQPVGPALHGHVELNLEQTQLPALQLMRRCFRWVRCWRRALAMANPDLQPDSNPPPPASSNCRSVFSTLCRPHLLIFVCLQFFHPSFPFT